ncbi:hypothetical protein AN964_23225 [Heyndrickxia shackletonii]|uniref:Glutaredoxin domain-containing protein n=1 Tax=Heyndrickxia shackletonii TaxID=157838 RepID=A0A0Q3T967_9BACI|nr:glutaredoxin family protein [Heyndrickxia shackletonii]KQL50566.1 hypothetical protein AN964_23225 [Heyndrickxia shackletonii]NEY98123.1 glutaredoxin family protein [Heyndrickxia shackletonii]
MENYKIVLYSKESCLYCIQLKSWLKRNSIEFTEKNIQEKSNFDELVSLGYDSVPLIIISNLTTVEKTIILGFNKSKLKKVLNTHENEPLLIN